MGFYHLLRRRARMGRESRFRELAWRSRAPWAKPSCEAPARKGIRRDGQGARGGPQRWAVGRGPKVDCAVLTTEARGGMDDATPTSTAATPARPPSPTARFVWTAATLAIVGGFG